MATQKDPKKEIDKILDDFYKKLDQIEADRVALSKKAQDQKDQDQLQQAQQKISEL